MDATLVVSLLPPGNKQQLRCRQLGDTRLDSIVSLLLYSALIAINLIAIARIPWGSIAAIFSGTLHLVIGGLHLYRLINPFRFEVFGHAWPLTASLREVLIVMPFGLLCLWMARKK
jgi:hypothetical protein